MLTEFICLFAWFSFILFAWSNLAVNDCVMNIKSTAIGINLQFLEVQ